MRLGIWVVVPRHQMGVGFNNEGQILLLRHVFHPKTPWGIPGGWLNRNESPAECALRELWEETGITTAELGPVVHISREGPPPQIVVSYVASIEEDPVRLSSEILEWAWFDPDVLPEPLLPFIKISIQKAVDYIHGKEKKWLEPATGNGRSR